MLDDLKQLKCVEWIARSNELRDVLKSKGDDSDKIRLIFHYSYFTNKKDLKAHVKKLKTFQMQFELTKAKLGLKIIINSKLNEEEINKQVIDICYSTLQAGGEYDGWETQITK